MSHQCQAFPIIFDVHLVESEGEEPADTDLCFREKL
jgi:hypothetical protein